MLDRSSIERAALVFRANLKRQNGVDLSKIRINSLMFQIKNKNSVWYLQIL